MQVSARLYIEWLKHMADTSKIAEEILSIWLDSTKRRSVDIEDDYYDGTLIWDIPVTETKQIDDPIKSMSNQTYQHLMEVSPNIIFDNIRSGRLEWIEPENIEQEKRNPFRSELYNWKTIKHNPLVKPKPKYKILDFDDNILGEAFTMEEGLNIFFTRYTVFDKKAALQFIEEI